MPIPLPILDDRRFDDLSEELRALIPRYCPEWTDHNPSDAGITLLELLAWLGESLIYRLDRIPEASLRQLLALLRPEAEVVNDRARAIEDLRALVLADLETPWRAVTSDDFESLVSQAFSDRVARVRCLPDTDLDAAPGGQDRPGHVSLVVVPRAANPDPATLSALLTSILTFLDERRLLTCRLHAAPPGWVEVAVSARVVRAPGRAATDVTAALLARLHSFFAPVGAGDDSSGWPFGKDVHLSEVAAALEGVAGVDHVKHLCLFPVAAGAIGPRMQVVPVPPNSLVRFTAARSELICDS